MLNYKDSINLLQDSIENKYVFDALKEWVDFCIKDTAMGLLYGVSGLAFIAGLGYVAQ